MFSTPLSSPNQLRPIYHCTSYTQRMFFPFHNTHTYIYLDGSRGSSGRGEGEFVGG